VEIFARSLAVDYKKNFDWKDELEKAKQEGVMLLKKSAQLPEQISDILKMTMSGQTKVNLDVTGSEEPLRHLDRMINKVILAVLVAALLLGSSTICTTQMTPKIMEIPLLGVLGYLIAFILSLRIIWEIHKEP
jgi:ubiquinone biosynthesis protein